MLQTCFALSPGLCVCMKLRGGFAFFSPKCYCRKGSLSSSSSSCPFSFFIYLYIYLFLDRCVSTLCLLIASASLPGFLRGRGREPQMPLCEHTNSRSRQGCLSGGGGLWAAKRLSDSTVTAAPCLASPLGVRVNLQPVPATLTPPGRSLRF